MFCGTNCSTLTATDGCGTATGVHKTSAGTCAGAYN
jgi:hypothetical protein